MWCDGKMERWKDGWMMDDHPVDSVGLFSHRKPSGVGHGSWV